MICLFYLSSFNGIKLQTSTTKMPIVESVVSFCTRKFLQPVLALSLGNGQTKFEK